MVAWNEHDFFTVPGAAQNFLHDSILYGRPLDAASHCPEVDNVAYQEKIFGFNFPQEVQESVCLATASTKVYV